MKTSAETVSMCESCKESPTWRARSAGVLQGVANAEAAMPRAALSRFVMPEPVVLKFKLRFAMMERISRISVRSCTSWGAIRVEDEANAAAASPR